MATLTKIEQHTKAYADQRDKLAGRVQALQAELEAVRRKHMVGIRSAIRGTTTAKDKLKIAIEANPQEFTKPRTQVISGIRVGFTKSKGKLVIKDEDKSIARIHKHMPDQEDILIKTTEKLVKKTLTDLTVTQLRLLAINVAGAGDQVVIKPTDDSIDKLIDALLKEDMPDDSEAAA